MRRFIAAVVLAAAIGSAAPGLAQDQAAPDLAALNQKVLDIQKQLDDLKAARGGMTPMESAADLQKQLDTIKAELSKAAAKESYGPGKDSRKFSITGIVQSRIEAVNSESKARFPDGSAATSTADSNGNYMQNASPDSAQVKRARLIVIGKPDPNTAYKIQLDAAGAVSNSTNTQVKVLEAYGSYSYTSNAVGDGNTKYPSISVGLFANPYGYILPAPPAAFLSPERPMGYSENNNVGLWDSQDYDKGVRLLWNPKNLRFAWALVNGTGRNSENIDNHFDNVLRVGYASTETVRGTNVATGGSVPMFAGGVSLYEGQIDQAVAASTISPKKQLVGLDGEIQLKDGTFLTGEFTTGTYEKRSYFDEALAGSKAFAQVTDAYVNGNQVETYYIWLGHTFHMTSDHPLSLLVDYDVFQRSTSANNVTQNILGAQESTFYSSGSSFTDVNVGGGVLYNTSKNGRLRLWYDAPLQVAHAPGTPTPPNIGLWTFEYLMRF